MQSAIQYRMLDRSEVEEEDGVLMPVESGFCQIFCENG